MTRRKNKFTKDEIEDISNWDSERSSLMNAKALSGKLDIKCRSKAQKDVLAAIEDKVISVIIGPPGTGKTYLSCARALKGTLEEKMEMYMYPFISNFHKVIGKPATENLKNNGVIEILPIKFALGVTLDDAIIIIDEAQQISKDNLRTLITRIGNNSKMIFLGDIKQKSVNKREKSALEILIEYFTNIPEIGIVRLGKEDIVRHPIIKKIEDIFDKIEDSEKLNGK